MAKKQAKPDAPATTPADMPIAGPGLRLEWRSPAELAENPRNWRRHPEAQLKALAGAVSEVGWAGACLYNETTGRLIDGHARRKVAQEQGCELVPVLVGSWTEAQEAKILATLDPIAGLAGADPVKLDALLKEVDTGCEELQQMLADLAEEAGIIPPLESGGEGAILKQLDTMPPPAMSWALIGIPTVRFGEIAETIELLATVDGIILETTANDS